MLVEVDAAAVAKLLLVMFIAEGREVIRRLPVRKEEDQPQKLAVNAPRDRHAETPASSGRSGLCVCVCVCACVRTVYARETCLPTCSHSGETLVEDWARSLSLMPRKDSSGSPSAGRDVGAGVDSEA